MPEHKLFQRLRIKNEALLIGGSLLLDFFGSALGIAWMYKDTPLYRNFDPLVIFLLILHTLLFINLLVYISDGSIKMSGLVKTFYILFFLFQCIMTLGIFLPLTLILTGLWH